MFDEVVRAKRLLSGVVETLTPERLSGNDALRLLGLFADVEAIAAAGKTLCAGQVEHSGVWRDQGHPSATDAVARTTKASPGHAARTVEVGRRLSALAATDAAFRRGEISESQAADIAAAATSAPEAEESLIEVAKTQGSRRLRHEANKVRAATASAEQDQQRGRRIHETRYLRSWSDLDGAGRLDARLTPDDLAVVLSALEPFQDQIFARARQQMRHEPCEAYAADALVALARAAHHNTGGGDGAGPALAAKPPATIHIRVDYHALLRGHVLPGETCHVDGVGPIPTCTVRAWANDAVIWALLVDGTDIRRVVKVSRGPSEAQKVALLERDRGCTIRGCGRTKGLEIHHAPDWAVSRRTTLDELTLRCEHHHDLITYGGYTTTRADDGSWDLHAPDRRHPRPPHPPPPLRPPNPDAARRLRETLEEALDNLDPHWRTKKRRPRPA